MNSDTVTNVRHLMEAYGSHIKTDKQLLLMYWQRVDRVELSKETISTTDFINKATCPSDILSAKVMLECMRY